MTTHETTDATPVRLTTFDNYEIGPCTRTEEPDRPGHFDFEACEPHEADVWTLYGHIPREGADAIGDFATRAHAEETFQRITGIAFAGSYEVEARLRVMHGAKMLLEAVQQIRHHTVQGHPATLNVVAGIAERVLRELDGGSV